MTERGSKYFKGWLIKGGRPVPYVIWDGDVPAPALLTAERLTGNIIVVHAKPKWLANFASTLGSLSEAADAVIITTSNHETYRKLVAIMDGLSDFRSTPGVLLEEALFEPTELGQARIDHGDLKSLQRGPGGSGKQ
jgi:hypothetical protein